MSFALENLVCGYPGVEPLNYPLTIEIESPGIYAVVGPNGCGKSTLLKTILGLQQPLQGKISLNGVTVRPHVRLPEGVSYVPQSHGVNRYYDISVERIVAQGFVKKVDDGVLDALLRVWDIHSARLRSFHSLSLGQKTRALIARALASHPNVLFLDEPLANLDAHCQRFLIETLRMHVEKNAVQVVMVDHHFERFASSIDRYLIFSRKHDHDACTHVESRVSHIAVSSSLEGAQL